LKALQTNGGVKKPLAELTKLTSELLTKLSNLTIKKKLEEDIYILMAEVSLKLSITKSKEVLDLLRYKYNFA
jgi:hypothetical protein